MRSINFYDRILKSYPRFHYFTIFDREGTKRRKELDVNVNRNGDFYRSLKEPRINGLVGARGSVHSLLLIPSSALYDPFATPPSFSLHNCCAPFAVDEMHLQTWPFSFSSVLTSLYFSQ